MKQQGKTQAYKKIEGIQVLFFPPFLILYSQVTYFSEFQKSLIILRKVLPC